MPETDVLASIDPSGIPVAKDALSRHALNVRFEPPPWRDPHAVAVLIDPDTAITNSDVEQLPALRAVVTASTGFDNVQLTGPLSERIVVSAVPDYCTEEVAETTIALILVLIRGVAFSDRGVRAGGWTSAPQPPLSLPADTRLGLLGFGRIARRVAAKAAVLGFEIVACDPHVSALDIRDAGVLPIDWDELWADSDVVSLHVPLTASTRAIVGAAELDRMKSSAFLVNTARGALVDLDALLAALDADQLRGAALDVLPVEPPPTDQAPSHDRLVVTSHIGWNSTRAVAAAYARAADTISELLAEAAFDTSGARQLA